ncbi:MAG: hypothetical protein ACE5EM_01085 [Sphingomonadales bacterium]
MFRQLAVGLIALCWLASGAGPVEAAEQPNARALRAHALIIGELKLLHQADLVSFDPASVRVPHDDRQIRHVMQRARKLMGRVQKLRFMNGLPRNRAAPIEAKIIGTEDLAAMIEAILREVRELRPIYRISNVKPPRDFAADGTLKDIMQGLALADAMVEALGVPAPVPNDVYRTALSINAALDRLLSARGLKPVEVKATERNKVPTDVYARVHEFLELLKRTVEEQPDFNIPGGITLPGRKTEPIKPKDVLDLLDDMLADILALKAAIGIRAPAEFTREQVGKTPSDVFDQISRALFNLNRLRLQTRRQTKFGGTRNAE